MAKDKKRGFFSWLGFGQKEENQPAEQEQQAAEQQPVTLTPEEQAEQVTTEQVTEETQQVAETSEPVVEMPEAVEQAEAAAPHSVEEAEAFAQEVVETSEKLAESDQALPESKFIPPQPELEEVPAVAPQVAAEHIAVEEEPLREEVALAPVAPVIPAEAESEEQPELTDEELEALALGSAEADVALPADPDQQPEDDTAQVEQEKPTKEGFFARLKRSLVRTKENLGSGFISLFRGKKIDDDLFEELEEQLLIADVGMDTTTKIIRNLTEGASRKQLRDAEALYGLLKEEMGDILAKVDEPLNVEGKTPFVILMVGVNGVGKTTTIGKMARQYQQQGKSVMLAAGDTFRAAAVEQLQVWGQRNNIPVVAQHTGADSASVIFDAIQAAKARGVDVLIADTAGRLQNKSHLMEELKKIVRVMKKLDEDAPHEVMLTLDASTGQNAVSQAKLFNEAVGLTGITLTKLDGTAKGGVIFSIADQFGIPIRYIGVGERIEDLRPFNAGDFIEALFARED